MGVAIASYVCYSLKRQLWEGLHNFGLDEYKLALYSSLANLSRATTGYTVIDELPSAFGYETGGTLVDIHMPVLADNPTAADPLNKSAIVDMEDAIWLDASFSARGGLLYNSSKPGMPSVFVLDFLEDRIPNAGTFSVRFPGGDALHAVLRTP
jgi:hypothetical protein